MLAGEDTGLLALRLQGTCHMSSDNEKALGPLGINFQGKKKQGGGHRVPVKRW